MEKTENIQGWFGHQKVYDYLIDNMPDDGIFMELGAWLGKSSSYLCDNKKANQKVIIVDSWKGSENELTSTHKLATQTDIFEIFKQNMGDRDYQAIRMLSVDASKLFDDESLDVVYIDLTHTYEAVKEDILSWYPKIKMGGYIAGDDYHPHWRGVVKAVDELLPQKKLMGQSFLFQKNDVIKLK